MAQILKFNKVFKNYGNTSVIRDLNFSISSGEIIALLGVNGAGKTTTIKMMLGQEIPTSGTIELFDKNPQDPKARISVGMTPQNIEFPEGILAFEILQFIHAHYPNPFSVLEMIQKFELTSFLKTKASKLSGGQKRRLALALAFIGNPSIVFLDEPTTGLDVESRKTLLNIIKDYSKQGKTIFLTTHYLEEIEQIATRIIFLQNGQIKADGSVNEIKNLANSSETNVTFYSQFPITLDHFHFIESIEHENNYFIIKTTNPDALIYELVENKVPFRNLQITRENLESAFIHLSKGN